MQTSTTRNERRPRYSARSSQLIPARNDRRSIIPTKCLSVKTLVLINLINKMNIIIRTRSNQEACFCQRLMMLKTVNRRRQGLLFLLSSDRINFLLAFYSLIEKENTPNHVELNGHRGTSGVDLFPQRLTLMFQTREFDSSFVQ